MSADRLEQYNGADISEDVLEEAVRIFNENYGVWGEDAAKTSRNLKPGDRVKLSKDRLRREYLPPNADCSFVRVLTDKRVLGHACACRWICNNKTVCWVTQLVVHRDYRKRGIATAMLDGLRRDNDDIYGIMSSHPAACLAAARAFSTGLQSVQMEVVRDYAKVVIEASPARYVRDATLRGSLFQPKDATGAVSSVDTNFWVNHTEPLAALASVRGVSDWPLGDLLDGHKFLLILEAK
ncbi:MAG: hypothetical protein M1835_008098 [Candelina submexicana]|nr:MAG: hypothetical protein M1835_008098 [Candelina submexicana]